MTRLENYLEKNCVTVSCAQSTKSRYYRIGKYVHRRIGSKIGFFGELTLINLYLTV